MSSLNEYGIIPECDIARADELARQRAEIEALKAVCDALRAELHLVLDEWNELVKASGSPTNGGAIGHVRALRAERDALRVEIEDLYRWLASKAHKNTAYDRSVPVAYWSIGFFSDDSRHSLAAAIEDAMEKK